MESNERDLRSALSAVESGRSAAADRLVTPWWYHPVLGLLIGGYVIVYAIGSPLVQLVGVVALLGAVGVLMRSYQRLTGVWISGHRGGRATWWTVLMAMVVAAALLFSYLEFHLHERLWPAFVSAGVCFVATLVLGRLFDSTLRARLRANDSSPTR